MTTIPKAVASSIDQSVTLGRAGRKSSVVPAMILTFVVAGCEFFTVFSPGSALGVEPEVLYAFEIGPKSPKTSLVQGSDGSFFGTTFAGGAGDSGTVFKVTTNGVLTTLVSFNGGNGRSPNGLTLGADGNFYGTTYAGGAGSWRNSFQDDPRRRVNHPVFVQPKRQPSSKSESGSNAGPGRQFLRHDGIAGGRWISAESGACYIF